MCIDREEDSIVERSSGAHNPSAGRHDGPLRVLHVIDGLDVGGAQSMLRGMLALADRTRVATFFANVGGAYDESFVALLRASAEEVALPRSRGLWDVRVLAALVRAIRGREIDLVHTHLAGADVLGGLAARLTGRPAVATLHSVAAWRESYRRQRRILADLALRRLIGSIMAVSETVKETHLEALRLPSDKIVVVPNVPLAPLLLRPDFDRVAKRGELGLGDAPVVCSASRLTPERDHETLVRALAGVLQRHPEAMLLVVGDGPRRPALERLVAELELEHAVRFLATRLDALEIMAASNVFCQPTRLEGLPVAVLDAMSLGLPVVASRVAGIAEVVEDGVTGLLVAPGDPDALAAAVLRLLGDPEEMRRIASTARQRAAAYRTDEWIDVIERVYRDAVG